MPNPLFAHDVNLGGEVLKARRGSGAARAVTVEYVPLAAGQNKTPQSLTANAVTWHRGSGASRKVAPGMNAWSKNGWTCDPGLVLPGPLVTAVPWPGAAPAADVAAFVEQDGDLYAFAGRRVVRVPAGSGAAVAEQDLGASAWVAPGGVQRFRGGFYVGAGGVAGVWYKPAGIGWSQSADAFRGSLQTVWWTIGGLSAQKLVGQQGVSGIRYVDASVDPLVDANWNPGAAIDVGPYLINGLVATRDHVYIATTGGLRDLVADGSAPNLTPAVENMVMAHNGLATLAANGWIYYGYGYALVRVRVASQVAYGEPQEVTPKLRLPDETPVRGIPVAITRYGQWVILAQYDANSGVAGGTTYISWGREAGGDEVGPMTWNCSPIVLEGSKVTRLHVSGLVQDNPRLWMGTIDSANVRNLAWAPLAVDTPYKDLIQSRPYRFTTGYTLYEQDEDWGDDALPKLIPEVVVEAENLGPGTGFTVSALLDGSRLPVPLGSMNAGPRAVLRPSTPVQAQRLQLRFAGTGSSTAPPVLRKRDIRAIPQPDRREVRHYQFLLGRSVRHANQALDGQDPEGVKARLTAMLYGTPVGFRDEAGANLLAQLTDLGPVVEVEDTPSGDRILAIQAELAIMAYVGASATLDGAGALDGVQWRLD